MATTVTFADLLNQLAIDCGMSRNASVGTVPGDLWHQQACEFLNRALRWVWSADDPYFAWPVTVTSSAAITVTNGVIAASAVGSSDWVSFWRSDPRLPTVNITSGWPLFPVIQPVPVKWDGTSYYVQDSSVGSPVFAFWKTAVPQGTFVLAGSSPTYATPTVPSFFFDPVLYFALAEYYRMKNAFDLMAGARKLANEWMDGQKAAVLNSDAMQPWRGNVIVRP